MYLPIGQVTKMLGVSDSTLYNWEKAGLIPKATRQGLTKARFWTNSEVQQIATYIQENFNRRL